MFTFRLNLGVGFEWCSSLSIHDRRLGQTLCVGGRVAVAVEALAGEPAVLGDLPLERRCSMSIGGQLLRQDGDWLPLQSGLRVPTEADEEAVRREILRAGALVEAAALEARHLRSLLTDLREWPCLDAAGAVSREVRHVAN